MNSSNAVSNPQASTFLIIVMGVSGCGKSTLAKHLADIYSYQYLEGDDFHSDHARTLMAQGIALTDAQRAPWVAAIKERLQDNAKQQIHTTLAFSGLKKMHREELRSAGLRTLVLYLKGNKAIIQERMNRRKNHFMAPTLLDNQFASMEEPNNEPDTHVIDAGPTREQITQQACALVNNYLIAPFTHSH